MCLGRRMFLRFFSLKKLSGWFQVIAFFYKFPRGNDKISQAPMRATPWWRRGKDVERKCKGRLSQRKRTVFFVCLCFFLLNIFLKISPFIRIIYNVLLFGKSAYNKRSMCSFARCQRPSSLSRCLTSLRAC